MGLAEAAVTVGGVLLIGLLAWFFFGPKKARLVEERGGVQEIEIGVKGGYSPDFIRVKQGVPVRLIFNRRESSDCTSRVVFPDFGVSKALSSDITLISGELRGMVTALTLSKATMRNIRQNLFFAWVYQLPLLRDVNPLSNARQAGTGMSPPRCRRRQPAISGLA